MAIGEGSSDGGTQQDVSVDNTIRIRRPGQFRVLLLNDDFTTMEFVVHILETIFNKSPSESVQIMLKIHNEGRGVCGLYNKQVAEAKVTQVHTEAQVAAFPLRCTMERI